MPTGRSDRASAAEESYQRIVESAPQYTPALFNLATLCTAAGDKDEAAELYQRVIEVEPDNAAAHLSMGFALQELGRDKQARDAFNDALKLDPELESRLQEG